MSLGGFSQGTRKGRLDQPVDENNEDNFKRSVLFVGWVWSRLTAKSTEYTQNASNAQKT